VTNKHRERERKRERDIYRQRDERERENREGQASHLADERAAESGTIRRTTTTAKEEG
jgi:hypothetical protein